MGLDCGTRREVSQGRSRGAGRRGGRDESLDGAGVALQGWTGWTEEEAVTMRKGNFGTLPALRSLFFTRLLARRKGVLVLRQTSCRMSRYVTSGPSAYPGNTTSRSLPCLGPRWQLCACGKETLKHCIYSLNSSQHLQLTVVQSTLSFLSSFCFKENAVPPCT